MGMLRYHIGQGGREAPAAPDHETGRAGERRAPETESFLQKQEKKRRFQRKHFICRLRGHPLWKGRVSLRATLFFLCFLGTMFVGARGCLASGGEGITMVPPLFAAGNSTSPSLLAPSLKAETVRDGGESAEESAGNRKTDAGAAELSLGEMEVSAYYEESGSTFSGSVPTEDRTVAADLSVFSIGDILRIGEREYRVEDKAAPGQSDKLRIYFDSYEEAMDFGRQTLPVSRILREEPLPEGCSLLGEFEVTAYCNCALCCGIHAGGPTASGTMPEAGRTVAVDPELIPLGTELLIDGERYLAEDTGRLIKGKIIDIYFDTHEEAMRYGRQNKKVYIRKTEEGGGR